MSGFSSDWLALREPADARARGRSRLAAPVAEWAAHRAGSGQVLRVVDLGSGTGANPRYLAPRLGVEQAWDLVEQDPDLLQAAPVAMCDWAAANGVAAIDRAGRLRLASPGLDATLAWTAADLAAPRPSLLQASTDLVTASALLDLVSADWIDDLAGDCAAVRCAALFALNYDGRVRWRPVLAFDAVVRTLVNRHQRRDKGFGPAAGPAATDVAAASLRARGYRVRTARSDWVLGSQAHALQAALARGWAEASADVAPAQRPRIARWLRRRLRLIAQRESALVVGHRELFAAPADAADGNLEGPAREPVR